MHTGKTGRGWREVVSGAAIVAGLVALGLVLGLVATGAVPWVALLPCAAGAAMGAVLAGAVE